MIRNRQKFFSFYWWGAQAALCALLLISLKLLYSI